MIRRCFCRFAFLAALCLGGSLGWTATPPGEYQIKAAYLLNFARYVEWPAARLPGGATLRLCVLGRDPFGGALAGLLDQLPAHPQGGQAGRHRVHEARVDAHRSGGADRGPGLMAEGDDARIVVIVVEAGEIHQADGPDGRLCGGAGRFKSSHVVHK